MIQSSITKMPPKILPKSQLHDLLQKLSKDFTVFTPKKKGSTFEFDFFNENEQDFTLYQNTRVPPKKLLFPQNEVLFSFKKSQEGVEINEPIEPEGKQIVFGIRNCDTRSFKILDIFFSSGKYSDPYYFKRRNRTIFIGLACNTPFSTCFCTAVGGDPHSSEGYDVLFADIGDSYIVHAISELGASLSEFLQDYPNAKKKDLQIQENLGDNARKSIAFKSNLENIDKDLDLLFNNDLWSEITQSCLSCGSCSFICPTCHCFDVQDEETKTEGQRVRLWDHCQSSIFTLETSGHNPRKS
ncbi:MAG: 4Fe-4S ferredoxin [Promethearchaeota archaeon]|nr:MAG: 4Fe-4S ferredoxin [Candidatus Lokiarchaeota archaeon]